MLRLACIVVLLAGCDIIWRLDDLRSTGDGGTTDDGHGADATDRRPDAPPGCLLDRFDGTVISPVWTPFVDDARIMLLQSDALVVDLAKAANLQVNAEAGVNLARRYDLTGATIDLAVPETTVGSNVETFLAVGIDSSNGYLIDVSGGEISYVARTTNVAQGASHTYSVTTDRFWRMDFRQPGVVIFSWSGDGLVYQSMSVSAAVPLTGLRVTLAAGSYNGGAPTPGRGVFDDFMLCGGTPN